MTMIWQVSFLKVTSQAFVLASKSMLVIGGSEPGIWKDFAYRETRASARRRASSRERGVPWHLAQ
jgi:hypothetical protein